MAPTTWRLACGEDERDGYYHTNEWSWGVNMSTKILPLYSLAMGSRQLARQCAASRREDASKSFCSQLIPNIRVQHRRRSMTKPLRAWLSIALCLRSVSCDLTLHTLATSMQWPPSRATFSHNTHLSITFCCPSTAFPSVTTCAAILTRFTARPLLGQLQMRSTYAQGRGR